MAYYGSKAYSLFRWNHISMFWVTICKKVRAMLSDRCRLSCLSVTLVYCGQTVRWLKNKLGMEVGLGPGHIMLHKDPAPPGKGNSSPPLFDLCLLWPNGCPSQLLLNSCYITEKLTWPLKIKWKQHIKKWLKIPTRRRKISKSVEKVRRDRRPTLCGWQVKLCDPSLTRAIPERLGDELLIIKCCTNRHFTHFTPIP